MNLRPCKPNPDVIGVLATATSYVEQNNAPGTALEIQLADGTWRDQRPGHTIWLYEAADTAGPSGLIFVEDVTPEFFENNFQRLD